MFQICGCGPKNYYKLLSLLKLIVPIFCTLKQDVGLQAGVSQSGPTAGSASPVGAWHAPATVQPPQPVPTQQPTPPAVTAPPAVNFARKSNPPIQPLYYIQPSQTVS